MDLSDRRKRVAEEAAEWWVHLHGEVTRMQREQYVDWLRESSVHVAEMLRVAQVHGALGKFERWALIPSDGSGDDGDIIALPRRAGHMTPSQKPAQNTRRGLKLVWIAAAMLVVAAVLSIVALCALRDEVIQAERAERRVVSLADGTVVQLDPDTRMRVNYEEHARNIFLERGRALFHVAKNPARPFLVQAEAATVRAVGTAFAVERQGKSVVVTVTEGKVVVIPVGSSPAAADASRQSSSGESDTQLVESPVSAGTLHSGNLEIFLGANEQVTVGSSGSAEPVRKVDGDRELAWADGHLVFENESVTDAIQKFNRYNRTQLHVSDAELARRPISGVFSAADPESFVAFIQSVTAVHVTRSDATDITIGTAR
jgi:transmembrane sensor